MLIYVLVSTLKVYQKTICTFDFNNFTPIIGPMSLDGPQYRPNTHGYLGKFSAVLRNTTQQYHLNSANSEIFPTCPVTTVSGTSPLRSYISWLEWDCIMASSCAQFSQSTFRICFFIIFQAIPFLASFAPSSDHFVHGRKGSVVRIWQSTSLAFFLNYPFVCSIALSMIIKFGTQFFMNRADRLWQASDLDFMGYISVHLKLLQ